MRTLLTVLTLSLCSLAVHAQDIIDSLQANGETREYRLHLPNGTAPTNPVPVVIALHGLGDNMNNFSNIGFSSLADTENFIAVYPQGVNLGIGTGWRIGTPFDGGISDVDFIAQMLDTLRSQYLIDDDRIYATGFSMGGFMSHILACQLNDQIAAIAAHSGTMGTNISSTCNGALTTPVMHLHGTADATIEYPGGTFFGVFQYHSAKYMTNMWGGLNGCDAQPDSTRLPDSANDGYTIDQFTYTSCADSSEVILYKVNGFEHNWLFANNDIAATPTIWEFFNRHSLADRNPADTLTPGINELPVMAKLFYPNPTNGVLQTGTLPAGKHYRAQVYGVTGRLMLQQGIKGASAQLDLSALSEGIYFIHLVDEENQHVVHREKVVVY